MSEGTSDESEPKGSVGSEAEMNPVGRGSSISPEMGWISRVSQAGVPFQGGVLAHRPSQARLTLKILGEQSSPGPTSKFLKRL